MESPEIQKNHEFSEEITVLKRIIGDVWSSIPVPLCSTDNFFNILKIGESFKKIFGYNEEEITGGSLEKLFLKKENFEKIKEKISREKKIKGLEEKLFSKDGKEIFCSIYAEPRKEKEGEIVGYIISFLDISEKKKIEIELEKKVNDLERLAKELKGSRGALLNILEDIEDAGKAVEMERDKTIAIINNFPESLLFFDRENKLFSVNPKAEEFFPKKEPVAGKTISELSLFPLFAPIAKVISKGENIADIFKQEMDLKEGKILEISTIAIMTGRERVGTLVVLRDISREKVVEKLKTEFVSIAAHQLRTPLSAIKWTIRMILDGETGEINAEQKDFLEKTYESNERMIHLVNDLLNVTKIEEGRFIYNAKNEDILKITKQITSAFKEIAERKGVFLKIKEPKEDLPLVKIDLEKISIVIHNLIDNAVNYTNAKGKVEISIEKAKDKKEIILSVKDTGIGISKDQEFRIFSRFFRGGNAVKADTEGTGLGLYIAKNIIEAHNGKIWFETKEGKGSVFYFTLPAVS